MKNQKMNLFIVDDNKLLVADIRNYLQSRFGSNMNLNISTFYDGESCLAKIDEETDVVILDYQMKGINGLEVLKMIKVLNPKTKVVMLSASETMAVAIEAINNGASGYVIKGGNYWKKLTKIVNSIITEPIRIMVREFGVSKYMAIFLLTFVTMGVLVSCTLYAMK